MANRFTYAMNFGGGFVPVSPYGNQLKMGFLRGEINDFIARKYLKGSFTLLFNDASNAYTFFITSGNEQVPFRVYEGANLRWDGYAKINGKYDQISNTITFTEFTITDEYTKILNVLNESFWVENIADPDGGTSQAELITDLLIEGINTNCTKITALTYSGGWSYTGNQFQESSFIGRVCASKIGSGWALYDNTTKNLRRYIYSSGNFSLSGLGSSLVLNNNTGNASIAWASNSSCYFIDDYFHELREYGLTTSTWTLEMSQEIEVIKYPSLAYLDSSYFALIDEGTNSIRAYAKSNLGQIGTAYNIGNIKKPSICSLYATDKTVAIVDSNTCSLRAFRFNSTDGVWSQLGTPLHLGALCEPSICIYTDNVVTVYDQQLGKIQNYTFDNVNLTWSETGTGYSADLGYSCALGEYNSYDGVMFVIGSESYNITTRLTRSFYSFVNGLLQANSLWYYYYRMPSTSDGCTFNAHSTFIGNLETFRDINLPDESNYNYLKLSLAEMFKIAKVFQNYWYVEPGNINSVKFIQPNLFSSVGTDIDVSQYTPYLNEQTYNDFFKIAKETIEFKNENHVDHVGYPIYYNRNSSVENVEAFEYTTDMNYFIDWMLRKNSTFENSGIVILGVDYYLYGISTCTAGTCLSGDTNVRNWYYSKTNIFNVFLKDYRYKQTGTFTFNNATQIVQDTVRPMIEFKTVLHKLNSFPSSIGSLNWGGGVKSFITELSMDLNTYIVTIDSVLLDL